MKHTEKQCWLELKQEKNQLKCAHQDVCELRHEVLEDLEESDIIKFWEVGKDF